MSQNIHENINKESSEQVKVTVKLEAESHSDNERILCPENTIKIRIMNEIQEKLIKKLSLDLYIESLKKLKMYEGVKLDDEWMKINVAVWAILKDVDRRPFIKLAQKSLSRDTDKEN